MKCINQITSPKAVNAENSHQDGKYNHGWIPGYRHLYSFKSDFGGCFSILLTMVSISEHRVAEVKLPRKTEFFEIQSKHAASCAADHMSH